MDSNRDLIKSTINASLFAQALTTLVGLLGIFIKLDTKHLILRTILILETAVQVIEASFYVLVQRYFNSLKTNKY